MNELQISWYRDRHWLPVARLALVSAFLVSGISKTIDFPSAVAEVRALSGLEPAGVLAALVVAVQLGGAALILAGGRLAWLGALLLGGFTLIATVVAHDFWTKTGAMQIRDMTTFFEHVGLIAGLFITCLLTDHDEKAAW
jgi:transmembrane protein